jgi:hypothetical protein
MGAEEPAEAGIMGKEFGVFVVTPPPSETILVARAKTLPGAIEEAVKWGGNEMEWQTQTEGVSAYGEKVYIEEIKTPLRRGKPLGFLHWDEIFETGVFEQYLAPELGFHLTKYGEVVFDERKEYEEIWRKVESWILEALRIVNVEPYSLQGREIYPIVVDAIIKMLKYRAPGGPREWAPVKHRWEPALVLAFQNLLKANK